LSYDEKIPVGVVGVGYAGKHHAEKYALSPKARLVGVVDVDAERAKAVGRDLGVPAMTDPSDLFGRVRCVSIAVPTRLHHELTHEFLAAGIDGLVEKPMTARLDEAEDLIRLAAEKGAILQVGHIERFNPAVEPLRKAALHPRFIEVHRLSPFSPRSLDVDVVLDLMIHDLDIVLCLDGSSAVQVDAVGVPVLTSKVDIANVRLRFASGLIANLTASRVSAEKVRKFRVFSPKTYISVDFAARSAQVYRLIQGEGGPEITSERTAAPDEEPLKRQLASFVAAVRDRSAPVVGGADGLRALALAHTVLNRISG